MTRIGYIEFNHIYVIQSLQPGDKRTGEQLHRESIERHVKELNQGGIEIGASMEKVEGIRELYNLLERIRREVETEERFPILHFEIHGSSDKKGLLLHSGEFVPWGGLIQPLTNINREMRNNLVLTLAVCSGAYLATILRAAREAPFWALVGPDRREWDGELFDGFKAFYETFLTTLDGAKAVKALRAATEATGEAKYLFLNAEEMFGKAFRAYVDQACNPKSVQERVARIIGEAKRRGPLPVEAWEELAASLAARMSDVRPTFEEYRRIFFMIDRYPENDERFPITFEQVMAPSAPAIERSDEFEDDI